MRNIYYFYRELAALQKPVISLILPTADHENKDAINDFHRAMCERFGFNIIDVQARADKSNLFEKFIKKIDQYHILPPIMRDFGRKIALNLGNFAPPKPCDFDKNRLEFKEISANELEKISGDLTPTHQQNSMYDELAIRLQTPTQLRFPAELRGFSLIALHTWSAQYLWSMTENLSTLRFTNQRTSIEKMLTTFNCVVEFHHDFVIDGASVVGYKTSADADVGVVCAGCKGCASGADCDDGTSGADTQNAAASTPPPKNTADNLATSAAAPDNTATLTTRTAFVERYHNAHFHNPAHTIAGSLGVVGFLLVRGDVADEFAAAKALTGARNFAPNAAQNPAQNAEQNPAQNPPANHAQTPSPTRFAAKYDFSHLAPDLQLFYDVIEAYNTKIFTAKLGRLKKFFNFFYRLYELYKTKTAKK